MRREVGGSVFLKCSDKIAERIAIILRKHQRLDDGHGLPVPVQRDALA